MLVNQSVHFINVVVGLMICDICLLGICKFYIVYLPFNPRRPFIVCFCGCRSIKYPLFEVAADTGAGRNQ